MRLWRLLREKTWGYCLIWMLQIPRHVGCVNLVTYKINLSIWFHVQIRASTIDMMDQPSHGTQHHVSNTQWHRSRYRYPHMSKGSLSFFKCRTWWWRFWMNTESWTSSVFAPQEMLNQRGNSMGEITHQQITRVHYRICQKTMNFFFLQMCQLSFDLVIRLWYTYIP